MVITAIGVQQLNCASMRDRDHLNVPGERYERFAVLYIIACIYTPTNKNNTSNHYKPSHKHQPEMYYMSQTDSCKLRWVKSKIIT